MGRVDIKKDVSGRMLVSFPYDSLLVAKVKTIEGRRWHPAEKHWSFPNTGGMLESILKVFEGEQVPISTLSCKPSFPNLRDILSLLKKFPHTTLKT